MITKANLLSFLKEVSDDTKLNFVFLGNEGDIKINPIHMSTHINTCMSSGNEHVSVKIIFTLEPNVK